MESIKKNLFLYFLFSLLLTNVSSAGTVCTATNGDVTPFDGIPTRVAFGTVCLVSPGHYFANDLVVVNGKLIATNPDRTLTIIDGEFKRQNGDGVPLSVFSRVEDATIEGFTITGGASGINVSGSGTVILENLTIEGINNPESSAGSSGGISGTGNLDIFDVIIRDVRSASTVGGRGIGFLGDNLTVNYTLIEQTDTAISIDPDATAVISNTLIQNNFRGIYTYGATTLNDVNILNNGSSNINGGGIFKGANNDSDILLNIYGGSVKNNTAIRGGGIYIQGSRAILNSFTDITLNTATENITGSSGGGIYCTSNNELRLESSTVHDNLPGNISSMCGNLTTPVPPPAVPEPELGDGNSGGNNRNDFELGEPISTFSGELFNQFGPDLSLGGPMGLSFSRYYSSALSSDAIATSTLGTNWRHNFDWQLSELNEKIDVLSQDGSLIDFDLVNGLWEQTGKLTVRYQLLEDGGTGEYTLLELRSQTLYQFNSTGRLLSISDGKGNVHTLTYNGTDQLLQVSDGLGRNLSMTYTGSELTSVSDGTRTVTFGFNSGDLVSAIATTGDMTTYAYAVGGLMTSYTKPMGNVVISQVYDGSERVTSQTDGEGYTTALSYGANNITTITDPANETAIHYYTATGELTQIEDTNGDSLILNFNDAAQGISAADKLGAVTTFDYHLESGLIASIGNADTTIKSYTYSPRTIAGLTAYDITEIANPNSSTFTFNYDSSGNIINRTDQLGNMSSATYNNYGQPLVSTNTEGGTTTNIYNADATLASSVDHSGNTATYSYDALKRLTSGMLADGNIFSFTYDNANRLLTLVDENGLTETLTYDNNGNVSTVSTPLSEISTLTYDDNDRLISVTNPLGGVQSTTYDHAGKPLSYTNESGNVRSNNYDGLGRLTSVTEPMGNVWLTSYDLEGVVNSRTNPHGNTVTIDTDVMGRTIGVTSQLGFSYQITYDEIGLIETRTNPLGEMISFNRDARGNINEIITGTPAITTAYNRNTLDQIVAITDPNSNVWQRTYDPSGLLLTMADPLGNTHTVTYDNRRRASAINYPGVLGTQTITYEPAGKPISRSYSDGLTLNYSYDANNRLLTADGISLQYDAMGQKINSNNIAVTYAPSGLISSMTFTAGKTVTYNYNINDQLISMTDWTGAATLFSYDVAGKLTAINRANGVNRTNEYDADARLVRVLEGASSINLILDANGQTLSAERIMPEVATAVGIGNQTNSYDAASASLAASFDSLGRQTNKGSDTYNWDLASRLSSYTRGGVTRTSTYDGVGNRLSKTVDGNTTRHFVSSYSLFVPSVVVEKEGVTDLYYYVRLPGGELLYRVNAASDTHTYYHFDEMGNTMFTTDDAGENVNSYAYSPFGELLSSSNQSENSFTWQGRYGLMDDGDNLFYANARYYDAVTGRFISRDPEASNLPSDLNPYAYAYNNPLKFIDGTGREPTPTPNFADTTKLSPETNTVLGGLKSGLSKLVNNEAAKKVLSQLDIIETASSLAKNLTGEKIDEDALKSDVGSLTVTGLEAVLGHIAKTAAAETVAAGGTAATVTGATVAAGASIVYGITKLFIANFEALNDFGETLDRIDTANKVNPIKIKIKAEAQTRKQAEINGVATAADASSLAREERYRSENEQFKREARRDADEAKNSGRETAKAIAKIFGGQ